MIISTRKNMNIGITSSSAINIRHNHIAGISNELSNIQIKQKEGF